MGSQFVVWQGKEIEQVSEENGSLKSLCYNLNMEQKYYVIDLIPDFVESMEVERGRSKRTAENYERYLVRFLDLAGEITGK